MRGIRRHCTSSLEADEVTERDGIPITTPERTLLDLAGCADRRTLERSVAEALHRRLASLQAIRQMVARHPSLPGARDLGMLLEADARPARTRSEAEERFLALVREGQLSEPEVNVTVSGYEVDFYWRAERFVVEVDGFAWHASAGRFEADRRRDAVLASAGLRVMRVTWRQIVSEPTALLVRLAQALARAAVRP